MSNLLSIQLSSHCTALCKRECKLRFFSTFCIFSLIIYRSFTICTEGAKSFLCLCWHTSNWVVVFPHLSSTSILFSAFFFIKSKRCIHLGDVHHTNHIPTKLLISGCFEMLELTEFCEKFVVYPFTWMKCRYINEISIGLWGYLGAIKRRIILPLLHEFARNVLFPSAHTSITLGVGCFFHFTIWCTSLLLFWLFAAQSSAKSKAPLKKHITLACKNT